MKNRYTLLRAGLCVAAAGMILFSSKPVHATEQIHSGMGLAGISAYMDKYYTIKKKQAEASVATAAGAAVSEYENVGISIASNYVNIRTEPNTDSQIVGKLYQGCAATIIDRVGDWVQIKSGNAEGFINADYLAIGFDAEELIEKYADRWAIVNVDGLRIRMEPSLEARIATVVPHDEKLLIIRVVDDEWYEISMDNGDITGYVYSEYVDVEVEFEHAITIEEEEAELKRQREAEEALKRRQEEQAAREAEAAKKAKEKIEKAKKDAAKEVEDSDYDDDVSDLALEVVAFAKKFVGNRYVYGGTSLTNGCDCSGFVQQVYKNFGISIERDSRSQCAKSGYTVSIDDVKPGDLIFYTNSYGTVSHVAMYIGNGKIVHASDPKSGIIIGNMRYRTPYKAKRIID